jgi:hypothetical protein
MSTSAAASTRRLLELCVGYFVFYVMTGVLVKLYTGMPDAPLYHKDITYLANNTLGGAAFALGLVVVLRWFRLHSNRLVQLGPWKVPSELAYILPSGICTAVVIPTTTLMYTLPISVLVAMVIMRGSIIVVSRLVDALQIQQGILKKTVYAEENWAVVFALLAVATNVLWTPSFVNWGVGVLGGLGVHAFDSMKTVILPGKGGFEFFHSTAAMTIMSLYIGAYMIRIYIMNFYKNTRGRGVPLDNTGFFAFEQLFACLGMLALGAFFFIAPAAFGWGGKQLTEYHQAITHLQLLPVLSGIPFGAVAFVSVFIFMFPGRTATFAGLVNRLTSLVAGTAATVLLALFWGQKMPTMQEWLSLGFILVAVYFLTRSEKRRVAEGIRVTGVDDVVPEPPAAVPASRPAQA